MINSTRCAFMAKQACATFSQVVQKITPPGANNLLKFFFALFAILTLNAATAWAEETVVYTLTPAATGGNAAPHNSYTAGVDFTCDEITWNITGNSSMVPWRIGGKSLNNAERTLYSKTAMQHKVTKVEVSHGTASSIIVHSFKLIVASDANFSNVISTVDGTFNASSTTTLECPNGTDWSNAYYKFVYNVTVSGTSNKFLQFSEAKFYEETSTTPGEGEEPNPDPEEPETGETGTINFNSNAVKIDAASVTGSDNLGNAWTITTVGTTSYTANSAYYQVGKSAEPATSVTFTTTLPSNVNVTALSAKFGGFNGTAGNVTLLVDETSVGTGTLNATSDVVVKNSSEATGKTLTVTVTGIAKGVKVYYISYTYTTSSCETPTQLAAPTGLTEKDITSNSATLSWNEVANKTNYEVTITDNHDYTETFTISGEENSVGGLSPSTTYDWTVKAIGDGTNYTDSKTSEKSSFKTLVLCTDAVTITQGTPENGSFKLDKTDEQSTCNGAVTVTLSDIQPDAGYKFSAITQSGINTGVTIDNTAKTVTYAQNTIGFSEINVTFTELPKYTVTFDANTNGICSTISLKEEFAGAGVKLPDVIANDGYRFLGWATTNNATTANAGVAGEIYKPAIDVTLYAVYIQQFTVQWFANGELLEKVTYDKGAPLLAPTMPVNPCSDEKQHIGWTTQQEYHDPIDAPSPFFEEISGNVTANLKFYAVYATIQSAGLQPQELTETITFDSFTDGTSTRTYDGASSMWSWRKNEGSNIAEYDEIRLYAKHSMTIAPQSGCSISKIVATISENKYVSVFADGGLSGADKSVSKLDVTLIPTGGNIVITQSNQSRVVKFVVTFTAAVETPEKRINYTTSCTPPAEYTITWWANGEKYHTQTAVEGTAIEVPTTSPEAATYACDDKVFVGWVDAEISGSTDAKPSFITDFDKITENKDFFAVFATRSSSEPTAYTAGEVGNFVLAAKNGDKWYALPTNPVVNSGKIQGVEIAVATTNGVEHVTTANALGYTWTIANVTNGQTISDGSKYIYHKNGGVDDTDLSYGTGTSYTWKIEKEDAGLTFKAMNGTIVNDRGMLVNGTKFGGYSLSNETTNGYYRISVLPIADEISYSGYVTTCEATTEALSGKFSTGTYEYAEFATGNLQYKPSTNTWRFAKQQYQYVGKDNIYVGKEDYKGWIDLFGWSADDKFGVNPSNDNANYQGKFVDWGTLFPEEGWSTLSKNQWYYLLNQRTNAASLKQIAMVGETLGIMLFPDEWTLPDGCAPTQQTHHDEEDGEDYSCDFVSYNYTLAQWTELENAGAIFLPAAGRRTGGWGNETISPHMIGKAELDADGHYKHYADYYAYYWTSTKTSDKVNYLINCTLVDKVKDTYTVHAGHVDWAEEARYGQSVRLAKVTSTLIQLGSDDNSEVIEANAGQKVNVQVNRTFTANDGYYTICLPFNLNAEKIGKAYQVTYITEHVAEQGFNMVFNEVTELEAGQPYLILPNNLTNPIFENVTISYTDEGETVTASGAGINFEMVGVINGGGQTELGQYWVGDNGLFYNGDGTQTTDKLGLRVLFNITNTEGQRVNIRARVVLGENAATSLDNSQLPITDIQKVIENGQLIIIRNGEKYNIQGQKL